MNGAIQHGKIPQAVWASQMARREAARSSRISHRGGIHASRCFESGANPPRKRLLIATVPRIEIFVTHSIKRRKHFLIATRTGLSCRSGKLLPGADCSLGVRRRFEVKRCTSQVPLNQHDGEIRDWRRAGYWFAFTCAGESGAKFGIPARGWRSSWAAACR
jgi:hypothetical protein